jgi:hypothetical protein
VDDESTAVDRRAPAVYHCTSEPLHFFGRTAELLQLEQALVDPQVAVLGLLGPGGQGKTAIVQHWLQPLLAQGGGLDGLFFWSFYRGKDADLCLRELYRYAARTEVSDVSASYCVDHLLPILRRERFAIVLDGAEVVQQEGGAWAGRFVHPELGRLLEELASELMPGVVVVTTRFALPTLELRHHARLINLGALDAVSARGLLRSLGVHGDDRQLDNAAHAVGRHAKGVELLGTWLRQFHHGEAARHADLPAIVAEGSDEERSVARILTAFQQALPSEACDILALATAFRQPPTESRLVEYLVSAPVYEMLHATWQRRYRPFGEREAGWLAHRVQELVDLRLMERVGAAGLRVIDAHPLVRRGFEQYLGPLGQRQSATARAGFLRGRPDRQPPRSLAEAREEVELFHAYSDAGLWNEADSTLVALDNPKHRFLAPAFERELLLRFFENGDWRRPPLWPGFGRWRSLAICLEMLGHWEEALAVYRPVDAALRGDALLALGRLQPLVDCETMPAPWQNLWRAYRAHALCLVGQPARGAALARTLIPVDIYEWVHVFECLLRAGQLREADVRSMTSSLGTSTQQSWKAAVQRRLLADWRRIGDPAADLDAEYQTLAEAFDRAGLPWERALARLGYARWLLQHGRHEMARQTAALALDLGKHFAMPIITADALELSERRTEAQQVRQRHGYLGPTRP